MHWKERKRDSRTVPTQAWVSTLLCLFCSTPHGSCGNAPPPFPPLSLTLCTHTSFTEKRTLAVSQWITPHLYVYIPTVFNASTPLFVLFRLHPVEAENELVKCVEKTNLETYAHSAIAKPSRHDFKTMYWTWCNRTRPSFQSRQLSAHLRSVLIAHVGYIEILFLERICESSNASCNARLPVWWQAIVRDAAAAAYHHHHHHHLLLRG